MRELFEKVIAYSQKIENPNAENLFENWRKNKQFFYEAFGNKFIYEYEIPIELPIPINEDFDVLFPETIATFLKQLSGQEIYNNKLAKDYGILHKGMKLSKAFKYLVEDKDTLEKAQIELSMLIQRYKLTGTLCLSIHPLDFLSTSENNYRWRSCHALDGEYRAGNLSYMTDTATFVCYIKGDKDTILPDFPSDVPWNNKKWRCLLYLSEDHKSICAGRQYPFTIPNFLEILRTNVLIPLFGELGEWDTLPSGCERNEYVRDNIGSLQFNDLLYSTFYKNPYFTKSDHPVFSIGGGVQCLRCGDWNIRHTSTMMCDDCEAAYGTLDDDDFGYCNRCGSHFNYAEGFWVGDEFVCAECAETRTCVCDCCHRRFFDFDIIYNEEKDKNICVNCCA